MLNPTETAAPRPLVVASAVTLLQSVTFLGLTFAQSLSFSSERAAMNWTTILGFLLWALMLGACGWQVLRGRSWARSPIVMAQLIHLGVAWSFVKGDPVQWQAVTAWVIAATAVVVLIGLFHPKSINHLAQSEA